MLDSFRVSYYPVVLLQIGLAAARKRSVALSGGFLFPVSRL